jgi:hypothetical protein
MDLFGSVTRFLAGGSMSLIDPASIVHTNVVSHRFEP